MTVYTLPFTGEYANESFNCVLDDISYKINMRWSTLDESWFFSIGLSGQTDYLVTGIKALTFRDLLISYKYRSNLPTGILRIIDKEKLFGRPGRYDTGIDKRFNLVYITED